MSKSLKLWKFTFVLAAISAVIVFAAEFLTDVDPTKAYLQYSGSVLNLVAIIGGVFILLYRLAMNLPKSSQYAAIGFIMCFILPLCTWGLGYYMNKSLAIGR